MVEREAIDALEHLGLSNYEARVFVALHQLGSGTALEVHQVSDVARSQVYGTAEQLHERGLVEIQESAPKHYRPVSLEAARAQLVGQLEREEARAFGALEALQHRPLREDHRDAVSTLRGHEPIHERVQSLLERGEERIVFGASDPDLVSEGIRRQLLEKAGDGVTVLVISESKAVREMFDAPAVVVHSPPAAPPDGFTGRVVLVDQEAILVSVGPEESHPTIAHETAIWTAETAIARILVRFLWTGLQAFLERDDPSRR